MTPAKCTALACLALGLSPGLAWADFTVTFKNEMTEDVKIVPSDHQCIHHPNVFDTTLPASKSTSIKAEWMDTCSEGDNDAYIAVCVDYKGVQAGCVTIEYQQEDKYVLVKANPVGWPHLVFP